MLVFCPDVIQIPDIKIVIQRRFSRFSEYVGNHLG